MKELAEVLSHLPYLTLVHQSEEPGESDVYYARCPDFGDGFLTDGPTPDEALNMAQDCRWLFIQTLIEDGEEVPLPPILSSQAQKYIRRLIKEV